MFVFYVYFVFYVCITCCYGVSINDDDDDDFNYTIKLPDLENPLFGATSVVLSLLLAEF